jgi:hypothetical protein
MTDDSYPEDWCVQPPHPLDPRLGNVLDSIEPTPAERALVADMLHRYVSRDHSFGKTFELFWRDRYTDNRWHAAFLALLEQSANMAVGTQGEDLAVARLAEELAETQKSVAEFGS